MKDPRLNLYLQFFDPPKGTHPWFGGPRAVGIIRGVSAEQAHWKPGPKRHSIWELALHIAYWKYAIRRNITGGKKGQFLRKPANWPKQPETPDEKKWKEDRAMIKKEQQLFIEAVRGLNSERLDEKLPGDSKHTFAEVIMGLIEHDVYHTGQIAIIKRLFNK